MIFAVMAQIERQSDVVGDEVRAGSDVRSL